MVVEKSLLELFVRIEVGQLQVLQPPVVNKMDSEKDVYNLLNKVLGILKEENALRPDDASPVILFKEPEKLKVNQV